MMNGYGSGWGWMMLMALLGIVLIAFIVWAVVKSVRGSSGGVGSGQQGPATPQETLDLRFARGEIDAETYRQARSRLSGQEPG